MTRQVHPLVEAIQPIADALGGTVLSIDELTESDLPLVWEGEVVGGLRRPDLHRARDTLLAAAEHEIGLPCSEMDRSQKQDAVSLLNAWGAFPLRQSVEAVAEALAVSRFTVYNYLERAEADG